MSRLLIACVCALGVAAPAAGQARAPQSERTDAATLRVAGCYDLAVGRWVAGADTTAIPAHKPPTRFRLDSVTRAGFPADYRRVEPSSGNTLLNIDSWRWMDTGRIVLTWSANTVAGVRLDLHVRGDSLVGSAASFDETVKYDRTFATAPVVARRVACARKP